MMVRGTILELGGGSDDALVAEERGCLCLLEPGLLAAMVCGRRGREFCYLPWCYWRWMCSRVSRQHQSLSLIVAITTISP